MRTLGAIAATGIAVLSFVVLGPGAAMADPIEGTWVRPNGTTIRYAATGGQYCGTVLSGPYKGQSIGCMSGSGGSYRGQVNKLDEGKTYTGKAKVAGNTLTLSGCVLGGVICKGEDLTRR
jgi:uncharacterized protein (DUF2147 family)